MNKYVIVEIIPTTRNRDTGEVAQLSAIKVENFHVIAHFDYRLKEDLIKNPTVLKIITYDKDKFIYCNSTKTLLSKFKKWSENLPLLIIDNDYTNSYLQELKNEKLSIINKLNMSYTDDVIERIIKKYNLAPSNYIVDLLLEALIYESNNEKRD